MRIEDVDISEYFSSISLGVAVSGGRDSMALLDYLKQNEKKYGYSLTAINVEHGIRGKESIEDSKFVEEYCNDNCIEFVGSCVDAPAYSDKRGISVEQAARVLRYRIFEELIENKVVDSIALAHHLDDQCETLLMRIFRGTGISGLVGMQHIRGNFIRPFLDINREEIDSYIKKHNIPYRDDSTNDSVDYMRNFIRNEVLTKVGERYPGYKKAFARLSRLAKEQTELLDSLAAKPEIVNNEPRLKTDYINNTNSAIAKRSLYYCMKYLNSETDFEEVNINDVLALTQKTNGSYINLAGNVTAHKEYDYIVFSKDTEFNNIDIPFAVGEHFFDDRTISIRPRLEGDKLRFDLGKIPENARIRTRREGDYFTKFGGGTKSLGDYLTDKKVPKRLRDKLILITSGKEVLLISGMEISARISVDDNTKKIFTILEDKTDGII